MEQARPKRAGKPSIGGAHAAEKAATDRPKQPPTAAQLAARRANLATGRLTKAQKVKNVVGRVLTAREGRREAKSVRVVKDRIKAREAAWKARRGARAMGKPVSDEQALLAIAGYHLYDADGKLKVPAKANRVKAAAAVSGLSEPTARAICQMWEEKGEIKKEDTSKRGFGSDSHPLSSKLPDGLAADVEAFIKAELGDEANPHWVTRQSVQEFIEEKTGRHCSLKRVGLLLTEWGMKYGKLTRIPNGDLSRARKLQRQIYIIQVAEAMKKGWTIVCTDESYCNARYCELQSWAPAGAMHAAFIQKGGLGARLCFIHAIDEDGLITPVDKDGRASYAPDGDPKTPFPSAEAMFPAQKAANMGDYHANFKGGNFMDWVRNRLIPGLKARYPDAFGPKPTRTIAMVFDNAPYHTVTTPNLDKKKGAIRFCPKSLKKGDLIEAMRAADCKKLNVPIADSKGGTKVVKITLDAAEAARRGKAGVHPSVPELQAACEEWLGQNAPTVLMNDLELALSEAGNIKVIWNAANFPEGNPIELVWASCKGYAGWLYKKGRTIAQLAQQIRDGLYTNKTVNNGVTQRKAGAYLRHPTTGKCEAARKLFEHVFHSEAGGVQKVIDSDPELGGTLRELVVDADAYERATTSLCRNVVRWKIRRALLEEVADVEAAEEDLLQLDEEDEDADDGDDTED